MYHILCSLSKRREIRNANWTEIDCEIWDLSLLLSKSYAPDGCVSQLKVAALEVPWPSSAGEMFSLQPIPSRLESRVDWSGATRAGGGGGAGGEAVSQRLPWPHSVKGQWVQPGSSF